MNIMLGYGLNMGFQSVLGSLVRLTAVTLTLGVSVSASAAPVDPASAGEALARLESHISVMLADFRASDTIAPISAVPAEISGHQPAVSIPVPAALWLFGSGLGALGYAGRYARRRMTKVSRRTSQECVGEATGDAERSAAKISGTLQRRHSYIQVTLRERMLHAGTANARYGITASPTDNSGDRHGGHGLSPQKVSKGCEVIQRFSELAAALTEQPGVTLGRGFGRPCLKLGKRVFLVHDENDQSIAFRVGQPSARRMHQELTGVALWNPKRERQPKQSWVVCYGGSGETLVYLAAAAFEHALRDAPTVGGTAADQHGPLLEMV
jgi:hypothetical protein